VGKHDDDSGGGVEEILDQIRRVVTDEAERNFVGGAERLPPAAPRVDGSFAWPRDDADAENDEDDYDAEDDFLLLTDLVEVGSGASPAAGRPGTDLEFAAVEGEVANMMRPMLRDWLDRNMPRIVERIVREEIDKLGRPRPMR